MRSRRIKGTVHVETADATGELYQAHGCGDVYGDLEMVNYEY